MELSMEDFEKLYSEKDSKLIDNQYALSIIMRNISDDCIKCKEC